MSNDNREELQQVDILDVLLDEENREDIVLMDAQGRQLTFEQVAVIPHNEKLYCVLKPLDKIEGIADDQAIVFAIDVDAEGYSIIRIEENEKVASAVFDKYLNLLEEHNQKS